MFLWVKTRILLEPYFSFDQVFAIRLSSLVNQHLFPESIAFSSMSFRDVASKWNRLWVALVAVSALKDVCYRWTAWQGRFGLFPDSLFAILSHNRCSDFSLCLYLLNCSERKVLNLFIALWLWRAWFTLNWRVIVRRLLFAFLESKV